MIFSYDIIQLGDNMEESKEKIELEYQLSVIDQELVL